MSKVISLIKDWIVFQLYIRKHGRKLYFRGNEIIWLQIRAIDSRAMVKYGKTVILSPIPNGYEFYHELGHILNGDLTDDMYQRDLDKELRADTYAAEVLGNNHCIRRISYLISQAKAASLDTSELKARRWYLS